MAKNIVWFAIAVSVIGGLAYPKLFPDGLTFSALGSSVKQEDNASKAQGAARGSRAVSALMVRVYTVEPIDFVETVPTVGTVRADEGVELQAETNGKVVNINFQEGAAVKKGDLLVKLNDSDLQANLERYSYSKQLAELRFRRISELLKQRVVSQDEYDTALNEVKVQESFIHLYEAQIKKTEIRAPFDGVAGLRFVSVGAYVNASTRIATLQRLDKLKIDFSLPERYSARIAVGGKVHFTVAGSLKRYAGEIYAIDPRIDVGTRTLLVRALYPNTDSSLLPGAFANVTVEVEKFANAVFVPSEAVISSLDGKVVYTLRKGVAETVPVETGVRTATQVHILSGLQAGDMVIISGLQQVRDGLPVQALPDQQMRITEQEAPSLGSFLLESGSTQREASSDTSLSANAAGIINTALKVLI